MNPLKHPTHVFLGLIFTGCQTGEKWHGDRGFDMPHHWHSVVSNTNYSKGGREQNIRGANSVATYLNKKSSPDGHVVMSIVNPYSYLREELRGHNAEQVTEVLLVSTRKMKKEWHVGDFESGSPDYRFNTDKDVEYTWNKLKKLMEHLY